MPPAKRSLVWCSERCHKGENEFRRSQLKAALTDVGASLVVLKKAKRFGLWIERIRRPDFVLVTDVREARSCMELLSDHKGGNIPSTMIVVCETSVQVAKVNSFTMQFPACVGFVYACTDSDLPLHWMGEYFQKHYGSAERIDQQETLLQRPFNSLADLPVGLAWSAPRFCEASQLGNGLHSWCDLSNASDSTGPEEVVSACRNGDELRVDRRNRDASKASISLSDPLKVPLPFWVSNISCEPRKIFGNDYFLTSA